MDISAISVIPVYIFGMLQEYMIVVIMAFLFKVVWYFLPR